MDSIGRFWSQQNASMNREASGDFYRKKAKEHYEVLSSADARAGILDLGCGAGELLEYLAPLAAIAVALDYSPSMLAAARQRLGPGAGIELVEADIHTYLPQAAQPVWMTTGAINQYLDKNNLRKIIDLYASNKTARAFYLFDCIDPLRFALLMHGISYRPEHLVNPGLTASATRLVRRLLIAGELALNSYARDVRYLGSPGMGYGQSPAFWLGECAKRGLAIEVISSRYYEYRYHVIVRKDWAVGSDTP
jgi:SAM-dependent methyltransferase